MGLIGGASNMLCGKTLCAVVRYFSVTSPLGPVEKYVSWEIRDEVASLLVHTTTNDSNSHHWLFKYKLFGNNFCYFSQCFDDGRESDRYVDMT